MYLIGPASSAEPGAPAFCKQFGQNWSNLLVRTKSKVSRVESGDCFVMDDLNQSSEDAFFSTSAQQRFWRQQWYGTKQALMGDITTRINDIDFVARS
jgi:hypothetical protein